MKLITKKPIRLLKIGDKKYKVLENIEYINGLIVPEGFITDLASTPSILEDIFPHDDMEYSSSAILHDFLYSKQQMYGINRETSDKIFRQLMIYSGVNPVKADLMYKAVRTFGSSHYEIPKINNIIPYNKVALIDHTPEHKKYQNQMKELLGKWYVG